MGRFDSDTFISLCFGGPGAVFWMWVIGFFGMSLKLTEVTLSMLYRNTDDPDNPHGGPMYVAAKAMERQGRPLLGRLIGIVFCACLLISTSTGGNMFQAWNVAEITHNYFGVPGIATGIFLATVVGAVIIGGIKRIGDVAGHGLSAGLVMMMVQTAINVTVQQNPRLEPSTLLTYVNRTISKINPK